MNLLQARKWASDYNDVGTRRTFRRFGTQDFDRGRAQAGDNLRMLADNPGHDVHHEGERGVSQE